MDWTARWHIVALFSLSCSLFACSGDDDGDNDNRPTDDASVDGGGQMEDASMPDAGSEPDGGDDAGMDSGTPDGMDAAIDGGTMDADNGSDEDAGFDCDELDDACSTAGLSCDGNTLVDCDTDSNGCLVETRLDCTTDDDNNTCDDTLDTPACAYDMCKDEDGNDKEDVCVVDTTTCADNVLVTCTDDEDGCAIATRVNCIDETEGTNYCEPNEDDNEAMPACAFDPCLVVEDPCFPAGVECDGEDIVTCGEDSDGCLVETRQECSDMGAEYTCDPGGAGPSCEPCVDEAQCDGLADGDLLCDGNTRVECMMRGDGCLDAVRQDCGEDFTCCTGTDTPTAGCPDVSAASCVYTDEATCDSDIEQVFDAAGSFPSYDTESAGNEFGNFPCPDPNLPFVAGSPDMLFALDIPAGTSMTVSFASSDGFASTGVWMLLTDSCTDTDDEQAEATCSGVSNRRLTRANETDTTARYYLIVDADDNVFQDNTGTFGLEVDVRALDCGDGNQDGSEQCDDGNNLPDDGCAPDCTLEENFVCTESLDDTPSICTRRPADGICGNVQCPSLPDDAADDAEICCTPDQECGVGQPSAIGGACLPRGPGDPDDECDNEGGGLIGFFFGFPVLDGCCTPDGACGLIDENGAGCVEREVYWQAMLDGAASAIYDGPLDAQSCTPGNDDE